LVAYLVGVGKRGQGGWRRLVRVSKVGEYKEGWIRNFMYLIFIRKEN
jgi:hypothetical protein